MGDVINLSRARKQRLRSADRVKAEANRALHGLSRAERVAALKERERAQAHVEAHRREPEAD